MYTSLVDYLVFDRTEGAWPEGHQQSFELSTAASLNSYSSSESKSARFDGQNTNCDAISSFEEIQCACGAWIQKSRSTELCDQQISTLVGVAFTEHIELQQNCLSCGQSMQQGAFAQAKSAKLPVTKTNLADKIVYNSCFQLIIDYLTQNEQINTRSLSKRLAFIKVLILKLQRLKIQKNDQIVLVNGYLKRAISNVYTFEWIQPQDIDSLTYLYKNGIRLNYDLTKLNIFDIESIDLDLTQLRGNLNISGIYKNDQLPETLYVSTLICDGIRNYTVNMNKRLSRLPNLPYLTGSLFCQFNNLRELPNLDHLTVSLDCSHNQLTRLPDLDNLTVSLNCSYNRLTHLPRLNQQQTPILYAQNNIIKLQNSEDQLNSLGDQMVQYNRLFQVNGCWNLINSD